MSLDFHRLPSLQSKLNLKMVYSLLVSLSIVRPKPNWLYLLKVVTDVGKIFIYKEVANLNDCSSRRY